MSRYFFTGITIAFLLPWLALIILPAFQMAHLKPMDAQGEELPIYQSGLAQYGKDVYAAQGCRSCHTQMIRPLYAGSDQWREGWGTRRALPEDYLFDPVAFLGSRRNGPDLSNVGVRITDASWFYTHLYEPRIYNDWSFMPSYRFLFEKRKIVGERSEDALALEGVFAPAEGYEIVPRYEAKALVAYLLSLKKDYAIEVEEQSPAEEGETTE